MSKKSDKPWVSVGMITYNHEPYLSQAIESIISQTTTFKFDLIIGEDCSTDSTRKICERYVAKYPEVIKLLPSEKNLGVIANFGRTLLACSGKYTALCEGDDYWTDPLKLQKQVDFLESNQDFAACYHDVQVVDANGKLIRKSKNSFLHNKDLSAEEMMGGRVMSIVSLCYRNVFNEFPDEFYKSPTGDNFLCSLLGNFGKGKYMTDVEPSAYRMHLGGMWSLQNDQKKKMTLLLSYFWMWQYYTRIKKTGIAYGFYRKIILEGFYSNPFEGFPFGKAELFIIGLVRKFFRLIRKLSRKTIDVTTSEK
jgi:glycosyltransferase involved in cell wall biosynthesis